MFDYHVTESGFAADIGFEKFWNVKCRYSGLKPNVSVLTATVRALKMHGGGPKVVAGVALPEEYTKENLALVEKGMANMLHHIDIIRNPESIRWSASTASTPIPRRKSPWCASAEAAGARCAVSTHWATAATALWSLADAVMDACKRKINFKFLYPIEMKLRDRVDKIAKEVYGADGVSWTAEAEAKAKMLESDPKYDDYATMMVKTHLTLTHDPTHEGRAQRLDPAHSGCLDLLRRQVPLPDGRDDHPDAGHGLQSRLPPDGRGRQDRKDERPVLRKPGCPGMPNPWAFFCQSSTKGQTKILTIHKDLFMAASENKKVGAVMVAGAGIAGIQTALDLANSGFYVYLVEKKSAIGGVMAQLDKTFPTNDCSMCIISPKLVEAGRHLNIELLTLTEVQEVSGDPGNFQVKILEQPRYVDKSKCTACGECAKACPIEVSNLFDMGLRNRKAAYKFYPQAMPSAYAIEKRGTAPCKATCPAHVSVQGFIALINQNKYREALALFKEAHPFPGICGRVCHHPCEGICTRGDVDQSIAIQNLHRFLADEDLAQAERYVPEVKERKAEKIAVVGSGPAGLGAAYFLAQDGYPVTVYEKLPVAGGMMAVGIPEYRLPRDILRSEIQTIEALGVEIKTGVTFGQDITLDSLKAEGFQAVFLATGLHVSRGLNVEGEDLPGVLKGVEFLKDSALENPVPPGQKSAGHRRRQRGRRCGPERQTSRC